MSPSRLGKLVILSTVAVLAMSGVAYASDEVVDNVDAVSGNNPGQINLTATGSAVVKYKIVADGACDATASTQATVVLSANPSAGLSISPSTLTFSSCNTEQNVTYTGQNVTAAEVTHAVTAVGTIPGASSPNRNLDEQDARLTVVVGAGSVAAPDGDSDGVPDATDNCPTVANADQANSDGDALGNACDNNSYAPAVGTQAGDADGNEGTPGNPTTSGSFTDQDGNGTLTLSLGAGDPGTLTPDGSGGFSWSHTTTDDDPGGTITVTASDGEHTSATQSFLWSASNVDPVVGTVTTTATGACSMSLSAPFSDQGSADTHSSSIDWGDGSATTDTDPDTTPVTGSHTYAANGTYTASVTVTDDDGGSDTESAATGFATKNTASSIMQPINTNGTRSSFKVGQTIPVKITVTGCDGAAVTNLSPTVTLYKLDGVPNPGDVETPAATTATNGLAMRWSDTQYIYNLSTKLSQQYGTALTAGSYRVSVNDPSFYSRTTADFELRK